MHACGAYSGGQQVRTAGSGQPELIELALPVPSLGELPGILTVPEGEGPFPAVILLQGVESLPLRIERHIENALKVVDFLSKHPKVKSVSHPSLPTHKDHELYKRYFPKGAGSIFTFEIKGTQDDAWKFIDALQIFSLLANVADVKSLVIHPATTTHSQLSPEELKEQHITPTTIRLSVGVEHIDDIIDDLQQALER